MELYSIYFSEKRPSFLMGIARILDITTSLDSHTKLYKYDSEYKDFYGIYSDWKIVGDDIKNAIGGTHLLSK